MRMYPIDLIPLLCGRHWGGAHRECHALAAVLNGTCRKRSIKGHVARGQVDPRQLVAFHAALVAEGRRRGYPSCVGEHFTPLRRSDLPTILPEGRIDRRGAMDKIRTCAVCLDPLAATSGAGA